MSVSRRRFLAGAAVGGAATTLAAPAFAQSRPRVRWNMPTSWPPRLLLQDAATMLAKRVSELTEGAFDIRVYPAGELVPPLEVFGAVQAGTVECAHSWGGYYIGTSNAIAFDGGLPFGMNPEQHSAWWFFGGGREAMNSVYEKFNMITFLCGDTDAQMGGWFNKEINNVGDLRGLRLRIAGLAGRMYGELGATTQLIPGGEILTAMERGIIDGLQFNNPHDDINLGLHQVSRYYYYPCWSHPAAPLSLYVNAAAWEALPDDYQAILTAAAASTHVEHIAHSQHMDQLALAKIMEEGHDFEIRPFPDDVMEAASDINDAIVETFGNEDPDFASIYPGWKKQLDGIRALNRMTRFGNDRFFYR